MFRYLRVNVLVTVLDTAEAVVEPRNVDVSHLACSGCGAPRTSAVIECRWMPCAVMSPP